MCIRDRAEAEAEVKDTMDHAKEKQVRQKMKVHLQKFQHNEEALFNSHEYFYANKTKFFKILFVSEKTNVYSEIHKCFK